MPMNRLALLACAAAISAPLTAAAQYALTTDWVNLRAGPAPEYPLVAQLPPRASVSVLGCLSNYSWCDVVAPGEARGWVYAGSLIYQDNSGPVLILHSGPSLGLPIVGFSLGAYWGNYYRERPWYHDRDRWDHWHREHRHRRDVRPPHYRSDLRPERPSHEVRPAPLPPREVRPPRPNDARPAPRPPSEVRPPRESGVRPTPRAPTDAQRREARPAPERPQAARPAPRHERHERDERGERGESRVPQAPR